MTSLLHINDNQLRLQQADGSLFTSQGYAWLTPESVVFDVHAERRTAAQHCRLSPQHINNRYWQQCDQSAITKNSLGMRHAADLIWQHLSQLTAHYGLEALVLIVPPHYQAAHLQLLLGIAQACQLKVLAVVHKAVAEVSKHALNDGEYRHVDVQLHQTVCSTVSVANGQCTLVDVHILPDIGIHLMQESVLHGLQNRFIQDDRFDPLHDAATEQQMFDQLTSVANAIAQAGKAHVSIEHNGGSYGTVLESAVWNDVLAPFSERITQAVGTSGPVFMDFNKAFNDQPLAGLGAPMFEAVSSDESESIARFLVNHKEGKDVLYQVQLTMVDAAPKGEQLVETNPAQKSDYDAVTAHPTHLVFAGQAIAIEQVYIEHNHQGLQVHKRVNGNFLELMQEQILFIINDDTRQQLKVNDRVGSHLADGILTAVNVL